VTIFDFTDSPSVGYAEDHEAGRIIEAPIDMARLGMMFDHLCAGALSDTKDRTGPMLSVSIDAWRKFADQMKDR
jgi:hypothetical protein